MQGWVTTLDEVPDPVFADRMMGDGLAIDPTDSTLYAPCDGLIVSSTPHAVTLRADCGAEILVHIGLETVALAGKGFSGQLGQGKRVKARMPLLKFDLEFLAPRVKSLLSPVVVANGEAFGIVRRAESGEIKAGDFLMELAPVAVKPETGDGVVSREVIIASVHGLHARPAALLSRRARDFAADIELLREGCRANAKSAVAVMALGAQCGDKLILSAKGKDAPQAIDALARLLETASREPTAPDHIAPTPAPVAVAAMVDVVHGISAAPGLAVGRAVHLRAQDLTVAEPGVGISVETAEFQRALSQIKARLEQAISSTSGAKRDILDAHLALLDDPELVDGALALIEQGKSAGFAWRQAMRTYAAVLRTSDDARLRERVSDLLDLERQVLATLAGKSASLEMDLPQHAIIIAEELLPSDLLGLDPARLAGFATAGGGPTSHVAILAAAMGIPALVAVGPAILSIQEGAEIVLDADRGMLHLAPSPAILTAARQSAGKFKQRQSEALACAQEKCRTEDGTRIEVLVNLGQGAEEAGAAIRLGAEGCGLLRSEFLFMNRQAPPSENEQTIQYQAIADALDGRPLVLRIFDIGGDKAVPYLSLQPEPNPALGLRGVRLALRRPDLLSVQLRAALRVKPAGRYKLMLPMVNGVEEVREARAILSRLAGEIGVAVPTLGVMIETPASAVMADKLLKESDFLSIGTNDLTQYTLAIDREHSELSSRLDGLHPAVLRLIAKTAEAAQLAGKPVGVCGALGADPLAAPVLLGLGIAEFSVPAPAIPKLKAAIRLLNMDMCCAVARQALDLESPAAVRAFLRQQFSKMDAARGSGS
jgi:phosphocarrier protein FPr/phosphocarrier protein